MRVPRRLGVYIDTSYRRDAAGQVFTNYESSPFLRFVSEVGRHFDELVLFGRHDPDPARTDQALDSAARLVGLPHYDNLIRAGQVLRAVPGTVRAAWRGMAHVDAMLVFGPYPFSPVMIGAAVLRRRRVVLGVRQDTLRYFRSRLPGRWAAPLLAPLWLLDRLYRLAARRLPTAVVGDFLAAQYGGRRPNVLSFRPSLVRERELVEDLPERDWTGPIELVTVGRIDPEKNPMLMVEAIAGLERRHPGRYRLTWIGEGRMTAAVRERIAQLGLREAITLKGFVASGPRLMAEYRRAHLFVHVAVTEAFGQVLIEAMGAGLPLVATDVGGVRAALDGGRAGVLVAPHDAGALQAAIERLTDDSELRHTVAGHGLRLARRWTLEREAGRVAGLITGARGPGDSGAAPR